jgi:hypothetical protein
MRSIYGILFGTLFIVFMQASFLDQAISFPDDAQALFNAGTDFYLKGDYVESVIFLERAKKCCSLKNEQDLMVQRLAENSSLNLAHSLVKAEKYQEALAEYKDLFCKFKNPKAEKNIPILEKFLQQQEQQDKHQNDEQDQDKEQKQDSSDQADSKESKNKPNQNKKEQNNNQSDQSKNNFDKKNKQEEQKLDQEQDQKEEKLEHQEQNDKQKENDPDRKKNQEHPTSPPNDSINYKNQNQNKQKIANQQLLDKDELALLQAIENFDQDMMKMYAAANCGGDEEDGW